MRSGRSQESYNINKQPSQPINPMSSNQAPDKEENREDELGSDCQCQATPRSLAAGSVSISTVLERFAQAPLVEGRREAAVPGLPAAGAA